MGSLSDLRAKKAEAAREAREILDLADQEKRALTIEEDKKVKGLLATIEILNEKIETERKLAVYEKQLAEPEPSLTRPDPGDGGGSKREPVIVQEEIRCMIRQDNGTYKEGRVIDPTKEFRTLGDQLQAVMTAARTGNRDRRLEYRAPSGASESVPSDAGFLVQKDFSAVLLQRTYESGQILQRVTRLPVGANSNGLKINAIDENSRATGSRWGGVRIYRAAESDTVAASKPKFRQMELNLKKLFGLCYATDEVLADADALEAVIMQAFPAEFSFSMENEILNGAGGGEMLGILTSGSFLSVAKEAGQAAATIVFENIVKIWAQCWARSRVNAAWFINQEVEPQLYGMGVTFGTGGQAVFMPAGGLSQSPFASIMGRPVIPVEYCAALGTLGDILLLDLSQYLMIDKGGMQSAQSIHVRFLNDETTFRFTLRNDGQPIWNAPLTPFKGTNKLSPFVGLATRA